MPRNKMLSQKAAEAEEETLTLTEDQADILLPYLFGNKANEDTDNNKVVAIYGEISEEIISDAVIALNYYNVEAQRKEEKDEDDTIQLIISTEGGSVPDMFALYDSVRLATKTIDVSTFGVGRVMSAGILLLASGTKGKRKVGKNCRLMLHSVRGGHFGSIKELETDIREVRWYQNQLLKSLEEETNLSAKQLKSLFRKKTDTYFDAEQAIEWGIADEIV